MLVKITNGGVTFGANTILSNIDFLLFVSHDRYFVKQIASSVLVFDDGNVDYYPFGYEHYLEQSANKSAEKEITVVKEKSKKKKFTTPGKEKAKIEARIKKLEVLLEECDEKIAKLQEELQSEAVISDYM